MEFLANENFPQPGVEMLRTRGYSVESIGESSPGIPDEQVLRQAVEANRIILTFDRDYGTLLFRYQLAPPPAVVYFRYKGQSPTEAAEALLAHLDAGLDLLGYFTVLEESNVRQRKL